MGVQAVICVTCTIALMNQAQGQQVIFECTAISCWWLTVGCVLMACTALLCTFSIMVASEEYISTKALTLTHMCKSRIPCSEVSPAYLGSSQEQAGPRSYPNSNNHDNNNCNNDNIDIDSLSSSGELGTCGISLVSPKQSVLRIPTRTTNLTVLTITRRKFIESRPRAARWACSYGLG